MRRHVRTAWVVGMAALLTCIGLGNGVGPARAAEDILFGATQYTRSSGPPNEYMETVAVPPTLVAPFRLHVQNGNPDGTNRVSSATITVNGTPVASQADFSQGTPGFDRLIPLQGNNTLQVRLTSTPGSFLVLTLYGTVPPPTLSSLEPPDLPITSGGIGTLMVTLSAIQSTPTFVSVESGNPEIAAVPSVVTVPAGQLTATIPVTGVVPGTAIVTAALNGSTLQSAILISPAGPTITSLLPAALQASQGAAGTLTVTLNAAQATDAVVSLASSDHTIVGLPPRGTVTVPAGQVSQTFAVFAVSPGQAVVTASVNGTQVQSQVRVVIPLPAVVSLLPPILPLTEGSTGTLAVSLNASQPTDTQVLLAASNPAVASVPGDGVVVPAGATSASFPVAADALGTTSVSASVDGSSATAAITVAPPPTTLASVECPGSIAAGATGVCRVSLNATQSVGTTILLSSSDPTIVRVPEAVTVPANTLAAPFVAAAGNSGTVMISAGLLDGTQWAETLHVCPPPPTLVSLDPANVSLSVGATATVLVALSAAQAVNTVIPLIANPGGIVNLPATATVPAGSLSAPVLLAGITPGTVAVTAGPLNGTSAQGNITVDHLSSTLTLLVPSSLTLPKGTAGLLTVSLRSTQAEATVVLLRSDDPACVEVPPHITIPAGAQSAEVPVVARTEGVAIITAGPISGAIQQAAVAVSPAELLRLSILPPSPTIAQGQRQPYAALGTFTDATTRDLTAEATWGSSDETVASITTNGGVATGLTPGRATITAAVGGKAGTATLTVTPPILATIVISPQSPGRNVGETLQFQVNGTYTDGTTQDLTGSVTWTTSNPSVALITSPGGLITALAVGQSTITATHPDGVSASTTLTVVLPPPTLAITSPANGATLAADRVLVRGTVTAATSEVGVTVNGMPALVVGTQWAIQIQPALDLTTFTAIATDSNGVRASAQVNVTIVPPPPPSLVLQGVPSNGVTPLTVNWSLANQTGRTLVQFELDPTGEGNFGPSTSAFDGIRSTYSTPGVFTPVVRVTDDQGMVYTATTQIQVADRAAMETLLQTHWRRLKDALRQGNIPLALGEVFSRSRPRYQAIFQGVLPDLPGVDAILTDLRLLEVRGAEAICEMLRNDGGVTKSFEIRFRKDEDGLWRLWMF